MRASIGVWGAKREASDMRLFVSFTCGFWTGSNVMRWYTGSQKSVSVYNVLRIS